ncbi:MAG: cytochrome b/b6 domain-containing protein [Pseudomonadota bacterium]
MSEYSNSLAHSYDIKIWDPWVRLFHWSLVLAFLVAYFTEDNFLKLHSYAGYSIILLLLMRIVWGIIGTKHARFADFIYSPAHIIQFIKETLAFKAKRYIGHNPAGGAMILILIISLILCILTGLAVYGAEEQAGPMAEWFVQNSGFWGNIFEELHEFCANFIVFLILIHILGVIFESFVHQENLIKSMLTGKKHMEKKL